MKCVARARARAKTTKYHFTLAFWVLPVDRLSHLKQEQEKFWLHLIGFVLTNTRKHTLPWRRQQMISAQTKASLSKKTIKEYHLCTLPAHVNRPRPPAGAKSKHQEQPKYPKPAKRTLPKCPQLFSLNAFNQQRNHC